MNQLMERVKDFLRDNHFVFQNYMELESIEPDKAVIRLTIQADVCNAYGVVHGGTLYTMADSAAGIAVMSDGRYYVTQSGSLHFVSNRREGIIKAVATVKHRGEAISLVNVDVIGEDKKPLAVGEFAFFCVNKTRMTQRDDT